MLILSFLMALLGFAGLALAMDKHHRSVTGRAPSAKSQIAARATGAALLLLSLAAAIASAGAEFGIVWWLALTPVTALIVLLGLSYYERKA